MFSNDLNRIQLPYSVGVVIGRVEQWENDPTTWDGWVDITGAPAEELVCNGGSRDWCRYMVAKRYQEHLIDTLGGATYWEDGDDSDFTEKSRLVSHCFDFMKQCLAEHYQEIRREQRRIRDGLRRG
jgi:hypothetical protein